jgi:hypothetical protein
MIEATVAGKKKQPVFPMPLVDLVIKRPLLVLAAGVPTIDRGCEFSGGLHGYL